MVEGMEGEPSKPAGMKEQAISLWKAGTDKQLKGDLDAAIKDYNHSLELYPTAEAYTFRGWAYYMQGHIKRAIVECKKAIKTDPTFGNPYNDIGAYLIELEHFTDAVPWLEQAATAERYECRHYPHCNLGRIAIARGQWMDAVKHFKACLTHVPNYKPARFFLTHLLARMN